MVAQLAVDLVRVRPNVGHALDCPSSGRAPRAPNLPRSHVLVCQATDASSSPRAFHRLVPPARSCTWTPPNVSRRSLEESAPTVLGHQKCATGEDVGLLERAWSGSPPSSAATRRNRGGGCGRRRRQAVFRLWRAVVLLSVIGVRSRPASFQ